MCTRSQRFVFSLSSFVEAHESERFAISEAMLRVYLQVRSNLRPSTNDSVPVNITAAATVLGNNTLGCSPTIVAHKQTLEVTSTMPNHWQEWNVTETLQNCWNVKKGDELLEMEVNFTLPGCSVNNGRIPVRVVDPAIVPLHQDKRRSKYIPLFSQ